MIGFKVLLIAAAVAMAVPATVAAAEQSVSDNNIFVDSAQENFDEGTGSVVDQNESIVESAQNEEIIDAVENEESVESSDTLPDESEVYNDYIDTVSDNNLSVGQESELSDDTRTDESDEIYAVMPLSDYESYYGTISTTYVEYFRGYLSKLQPEEHYVAARTGQYEYIFAYGSELVYDGTFTGSDVYVVKINMQSTGSFTGGIETTFSLDPLNYMVYSDLSAEYPALSTSSDLSLRQIVYVVVIFFILYTVDGWFRFKTKSRRWRR